MAKKLAPYPHLALPGTEIEVKATLKPLVDEAGESWHSAQAGVLLGDKVDPSLLRLLLSPLLLLQPIV